MTDTNTNAAAAPPTRLLFLSRRDFPPSYPSHANDDNDDNDTG